MPAERIRIDQPEDVRSAPVVLVGFHDEGSMVRIGDVVNIPINWKGTFPEAETLVLNLDAIAGWSATVSTRLRVSLNQILDDGGRVVLLVGSGAAGFGGHLLPWLQNRLGIAYSKENPYDTTRVIPALAPFFRNLVAHVGVAWSVDPKDLEVLAEGHDPLTNRDFPIAIRFQVGQAEIITAPMSPSDSPEPQALELLSLLPSRSDYPPYLDELSIDAEVELHAERTDLLERLTVLEDKLQAARRAKQILYFTGSELETEVVWPSPDLTDIHEVGRDPREDVQHGKERATSETKLHAGVQG